MAVGFGGVGMRPETHIGLTTCDMAYNPYA